MTVPVDDPPALVIPYTMAEEMGRERLDHLKAAIKATAEAETGRPHEWRPATNMDAIKLEPVEP